MKEYPYRDYVSAEVTLVWTVSSDEQKNRLIFAVTELIPENQLASKPLGIPLTPYLKKRFTRLSPPRCAAAVFTARWKQRWTVLNGLTGLP